MIPSPRIVAVLGKEAAGDVSKAGEADMIEVRLDLLDRSALDPLQAISRIRKSTTKPIIATNRMREEGGSFQGSEEERVKLLLAASAFADYIDVELRARDRDEIIRKAGKPAIVSYHDFVRMPATEELRSILDEMSRAGAAVAKIAVTPGCLRDNLAILELLLDSSIPLCVIAMGVLGRHLRSIAPIYGSVLTYGYIREPTAPGQMSVQELCQGRRLFGF